MALESRALTINRSNSGYIYIYVKSATLLKKEGSNISAAIGQKLCSGNRKLTIQQANSAENKPKGYLDL